MQTLHRTALFCCIGMSCLGQAPTAQVQIKGTNYPAVFTGMSLSFTNRQRIASELTAVFSTDHSFDELKGKETEAGVFHLNDRTMFFWDERENVFLVDKNNKKSIRVDKPLAVKYLEIFKWMDANSNTVRKAHEFVETLNSPDLLSKPPQELLSLIHFDPLSGIEENDPPDNAEIQGKFATDYFQLTYFAIRAQNFYFAPVSALDDIEIPLFLLFAVGKSDPLQNSVRSVGFYKGKWGFGNFPFPFSIP